MSNTKTQTTSLITYFATQTNAFQRASNLTTNEEVYSTIANLEETTTDTMKIIKVADQATKQRIERVDDSVLEKEAVMAVAEACILNANVEREIIKKINDRGVSQQRVVLARGLLTGGCVVS